MGIVVDAGQIAAEAASITDTITAAKEKINTLIEAIGAFVVDGGLSGQAYTGAKGYFAGYLPSLNALKAQMDSLLSAKSSMLSALGSCPHLGYADEDECNEEIRSLTIQRSNFQRIKANAYTIEIIGGIATPVINYGLINYCDAQIALINNRIKELEDTIKELITFNACSSFASVEASCDDLKRAVSSICSVIGFAYGTNEFFRKRMSKLLKFNEERMICTFRQNLTEQFGFDEQTSRILGDLYQKIGKNHPHLTIQEQNYEFARLISQLFYNESAEGNFMKGAWAAGAGNVNGYNSLEFVTALGISEKDFHYLEYSVRLQHSICSGDPSTTPDYIKNKLKKRKERKIYFTKMEVGLNISPEEMNQDVYMEKYNVFYDNFSEKSDFSHMMYTIAAALAPRSAEGLKNENYTYNIFGKEVVMWNSAEDRIDYTGWLGDATWPGVNANAGLFKKIGAAIGTSDDDSMYGSLSIVLNSDTSFANDDYMADLDAENIINRLNDHTPLPEVINTYYEENPNGNGRAKEFLENNSITDVEKAILDRAGVPSLEALKEKWPSSYNFIDNLQKGNDVLAGAER